MVNISFIIAAKERETERERWKGSERERDLMDMMMTDLMTNANAAGDAAQATVKYQIKNSSLTVMLHGYRVIE